MPQGKVSRLTAMHTDVDALRQHYADTLKPVHINPLQGNRTISVHDLHVSINDFDVWAGGCPSGMDVSFIEPPNLYALYIPLSGSMEFTRGKSTVVSGADTVFACDLSSIDSLHLHARRSHIGIAFDKRVVARQLSEMTGGRGSADLEMFHEFRIEGEIEELASMCKLVWRSLEANPQESIRLRSNEMLLRAIMLKLVEIIPHRYTSYLTRRHSPAMPKHVKLAIDYMTANVAAPMTVEEIAAAAGVSARALQLAFQQFRDTTPLGFLRQLRIHQARNELLAAKDTDIVIAAVAKRWGFSNMARFSALYLTVFGETPRQTVGKL